MNSDKTTDPHILRKSNIEEIESVKQIPVDASGYLMIYWHQCPACHRVLPAYNATAYLLEKQPAVKIYALNGYVHRQDIEFTSDPEQLEQSTTAGGKLLVRGYPTFFRLNPGRKFVMVDLKQLLEKVDSEMKVSSIPYAFIADATSDKNAAAQFARTLTRQ